MDDTRECAGCGATFRPKSDRNIYCTTKCRTKHFRLEPRRCDGCGSMFAPAKQNSRRPPQRHWWCPICWSVTTPRDGAAGSDIRRGSRSAFCSTRCARTAARNKQRASRPVLVERRCSGCGVARWLPPRQGRWTCDECRRAVRRRAKMRRRGVVSERYDRAEIFARDGWRCRLCGGPTHRDRVVPHPKAPTIDHITPLSAGGHDVPTNVQCAHFICNSLKSDRGGNEQLLLIG